MNAVERVIVIIELFVALIGCWWFVVLYTVTWPWWKNDVGRHLVAFSASLGLVLTYYALRIFWPRLPGVGITTVVLFGTLTGVIVWRLVLFLRIRRELRRQRRAERTD